MSVQFVKVGEQTPDIARVLQKSPIPPQSV